MKITAACRNFLGVEYHFIETPWLGEFVRREVPLFHDGKFVHFDAPGFGLELDLEVCPAHLAPGERLFE